MDELDCFALAQKLSAHCGEAHFYVRGEAHFYVLDPYNGSEAWFVARDGKAVRSYGTYDDPEFQGEPLPFEVGYQQDAIDEDEDEAAQYAEGVPEALVAADNLSVEPGPMQASETRGHGYLATAHPHVPNSRFPGALPIR